MTARIAWMAFWLVLVAGCATTPRAPTAGFGPRPNPLFWSQAEREGNFRRMETLVASNRVTHGARVHPLPAGAPLAPVWTTPGGTLDRYMTEQKIAGLMVVQDGRVRIERYGLGFGPRDRWTSFSVAKSFTSTLVGAAIRDGHIRSIDDPVTRYIPALAGSAYDGVSIRQLLTMTSGVRWNEDYTDPTSDVARMYAGPREPGVPLIVSYMRRLPRADPPGAVWKYKTGEADLIGVLVAQATRRPLATYLAQKIWRPYGMAMDAAWLKDAADGTENGGCCLSIALADYARMGQFLLDGGIARGRRVLPDWWLAQATAKQADIGSATMGYGYQWWTYGDGRFAGIGIFGQLLHIDRARQLVIVQLAAAPVATSPAQSKARAAMIAAITAGIDRDDGFLR